MSFLARTGLELGTIVLGFYGFWLVWRMLLPLLPGPHEPSERIAPYARYFTDPFVLPLVRHARLPDWLAAALCTGAVAAALAGLHRVAAAL